MACWKHIASPVPAHAQRQQGEELRDSAQRSEATEQGASHARRGTHLHNTHAPLAALLRQDKSTTQPTGQRPQQATRLHGSTTRAARMAWTNGWQHARRQQRHSQHRRLAHQAADGTTGALTRDPAPSSSARHSHSQTDSPPSARHATLVQCLAAAVRACAPPPITHSHAFARTLICPMPQHANSANQATALHSRRARAGRHATGAASRHTHTALTAPYYYTMAVRRRLGIHRGSRACSTHLHLSHPARPRMPCAGNTSA